MADSADHDGPEEDVPYGGLTLMRHAAGVIVGGLVVAFHLSLSLNSILAPMALPVGVLSGLLIGLPAASIMRHRGWRRLFHALVVGAALGFTPIGALALFSGGWREALSLAAWGAGVGLAAWLAVKAQAAPLRWLSGIPRVLAAIGLAIGVVALAYAGLAAASRALEGPPDLSCHNLFRNGGKSFSAVTSAKLTLSEAQWPRFRTVMGEVAAEGGWSMRDYPHPQTLGGSLCQEVGTKVSYRQWTWQEEPDREVQIDVYAPQGGEAWRPDVQRVLDRLEREWPGALKLADASSSTRTLK